MIRVFKSAIIRQQLTVQELEDLVADFRDYKTSGQLPAVFGRDALYDHPNTYPLVRAEQVAHIHLAKTAQGWPVRLLQFRRTSDIHLIYCHGALHDDRFLLIAVFRPDAHKQARDNNVMEKVGRAAELFRMDH
jgi:mRNA interferase YafO